MVHGPTHPLRRGQNQNDYGPGFPRSELDSPGLRKGTMTTEQPGIPAAEEGSDQASNATGSEESEETKRSGKWAEIERYGVPAFVGLAILSLVVVYPMLAFYSVVLVLILTPIVLLHEWGHYRVAKKAGLGIEEFSVGFGKRLWSRELNGVRWSVKAVPLGGSVEVRGMTVEQAEKDRVPDEQAFIYASPWTRLSLALAGVRNNLILAWLGFSAVSVNLAPPGTPLPLVVALSPISGIVVLGRLLNLAVHGLFGAMTSWSSGSVSSILSMPESIQSGVQEAGNSGMPLWIYFVLIFALINLSLAVFNLLPFYPLDGYHALTALLDAARSGVSKIRSKGVAKPLSTRQLAWYNWSTGTLLAVFVVSIFVRDIIRMVTP